jgi:DNA-binding MarR family transcriptional regulator
MNKTIDKPITQMMLAHNTNCDKMMVSKVLRLLEDRKYVMRKSHHLDTRSRSLLLTTKGMELIEKATPVFIKAEEDFFKCMKSKQKSMDKKFKKIIKTNRKALKNSLEENTSESESE